ncbi:unnamed protein product [Ilex paraguariensis]|uniref:Uncharacterized protein n=1 Tax=Ilex paraguariensis TaxID=185542 RepID=A0ABC8RNK8_9AQUA
MSLFITQSHISSCEEGEDCWSSDRHGGKIMRYTVTGLWHKEPLLVLSPFDGQVAGMQCQSNLIRLGWRILNARVVGSDPFLGVYFGDDGNGVSKRATVFRVSNYVFLILSTMLGLGLNSPVGFGFALRLA